jgi:lipopolysaccharide export LptBFGC system permease protein LptF
VSHKLWTIIGAVSLGLVAGWVDIHNDEVQPAALLVLAFSFSFSAANPRRAWLIALIMGGCIPLVAYVARVFGIQPVGPAPDPWWSGIAVPLILAFVAAYLGAGFGWLLGRAGSTSET